MVPNRIGRTPWGRVPFRGFTAAIGFAVALAATPSSALADPGRELVKAARRGNLDHVLELLAKGTDVNERGRFDITALWQASWKGHRLVTETLLAAGANPNIPDRVWKATPLQMASDLEIVKMLVQAGAKDRDHQLRTAAFRGQLDNVGALLAGKLPARDVLVSAAAHARRAGHQRVIAMLEEKAGEKLPGYRKLDLPERTRLVGRYRAADREEVQVVIRQDELELIRNDQATPLIAISDLLFEHSSHVLRFQLKGPQANGFVQASGPQREFFERVATAPANPPPGAFPDAIDRDNAIAASSRWPRFRGPGARGIAVDQRLPLTWSGTREMGIRWKAPLTGLANSSPIVWDNRIFLTSASSSSGNRELRIGLYGDGDAAGDQSEHEWNLICLSVDSGRVLWRHTAERGIPPVKRHQKSTQANPTPATDGTHVVAVFNSGGLYCYNVDGRLEWSRNLGVLDSGAFNDPDYQWGFASSPILIRGLVIVQIDRQTNSYLAAFDVADGSPVWTTPRNEIPSWGTPTVYQSPQGLAVVTNGTHFSRGNDLKTGKEIWRLNGNSAITVPTPFMAHGLLFVTSGYRPIQPIYAIRPDAQGDISLKTGEQSNAYIAWSKKRGGPYLPTPLVYGNFLYSCSNQGVLTCYHAPSGKRIYRKRIARGAANSYSASLVAADGRIYCTAESGEVCVIRAGADFDILARNQLGEYCLSTPAIASQTILFRAQRHLFAVGGQ